MELDQVLELDKLEAELSVIESRSSGTEGSFLIHHLLSSCLRRSAQSSSQIVFIPVAQSFSHYRSVQNKLGNSSLLTSQLTSQSFITIDAFTNLSDLYLSGNMKESYLDSLFSQVQTAIKNKNVPCYIVIDDISFFHFFGFSDKSILRLVHQCLNQIFNSRVIIGTQVFDSNKSLISDLTHIADFHCAVESLATGYSKEIDGQVINHYHQRLSFQLFFFISQRSKSIDIVNETTMTSQNIYSN